MGITDLFDCAWISSGISVTSVSTENIVGVSALIPGVIPGMIPGMDSLVVELSGIEIVLESVEDCVGAVDTVGSQISLISSCDLLFKQNFKGESVLLVAFLEELLFTLGSNISEMLQKSI